MLSKFGGTGVALATPLNEDYTIAFDSLEKLLEHTIAGNVDYLVVMGTTAESPVFSWSEKLRVLEFILEKNAGRKPIVFGLGGNYTHDLIEKSKDLKTYPIDAILSVSPYYSRPSQKGLIRHFNLLADAFPKPIILYNVPARTASNVAANTTLALAEHQNIIAMKDASADMEQAKTIVDNKPDNFLLLSGDDPSALDLIKLGASGVISVIANILSQAFTDMINDALKGDAVAKGKNEALTEAYRLLSLEGNPASLKTGLEVLGICGDTVKPPLMEGSKELKDAWRRYLES